MLMHSVASVISLFVCLSVMLQLLKALTEKVHFWYAGTISEYLGQVRISRSSGKGQVHRSKKACLYVLFAGGLPSTERHFFGIIINILSVFRYLAI